ncbi:SDR family NAD(P)-dependent oxidoreductase [Sphaerisporangium sp. NPDC088356]|uniref:SDR family NAD(P)-dependent oxidoreductase n=1 Tax=Sphaerisporangium sp. NPDC088356 TaxID=3154871 RepID=UPI003445C69C
MITLQRRGWGAAMGHVLVTGATGGIGGALVGALVEAGHRVTAVGRDVGRLNVPGIEVDLTEPGTLAASVGALEDARELGDVQALVHCAGISPVAAVADADPETWRRTLAVNVSSAAELARLTLPALRRSHGHVIFVNAAPGMTGVARWSVFIASKAALRELADSLREEEAAHGVRVTTIYPGPTATDLLGEVRSTFGRPYDPELCIRPETLAAMIVWVLSAPPDAYACELSVLPSP